MSEKKEKKKKDKKEKKAKKKKKEKIRDSFLRKFSLIGKSNAEESEWIAKVAVDEPVHVPYAAIHAQYQPTPVQYQPVHADAIEVDSTPATETTSEIAANEREQRAKANRGKHILYQAL